MMHILCIFPSGRVIDRTKLGERRVRAYAEEFPTLIYTYVEATSQEQLKRDLLA